MISKAYDQLREFADYAGQNEHENYLTLYLDVDPATPANQSENPGWQIFLKNAVADIEADLDPVQLRQWKKVRLSDTAPETAWARTRKRLDKYLTGYRPKSKSLALYISPSAEYRFELPVNLTNAVYYGKPHIQEFLWALDEYEQHLVLLFAEDQTRALLMALGETRADLEVQSDQAWLRQQRKAAHSSSVASRDDELDRRMVRSVANDVNKYLLNNPDVQRVVLGGNTELAHAVKSELHPLVREKVIAVLPIPVASAPHEIADRIRGAAEEAEREYELSLVNSIVDRAGANGRGATGYQAVGRAVERFNVDLLALLYPDDSEVVEPMLLQAVQSGAQVEFVSDAAADRIREAGGVVARLYYPITT